ncbi:LPS translocon maturation chaperone LptM [Polaromonas sp. CT11-55]|uniref:LPS translocon maturation chaperone LptM n=1 Tax=Polaromonas sp. CT11-55 TaxID=3243045 RepID=UPI0039A62435
MVSSAQILGRRRNPALRYGLAAIVAGAALLAGCGQKGPLYLPVPPKVPGVTARTAPAATPRSTTLPAAPEDAAVVPALPASAAR